MHLMDQSRLGKRIEHFEGPGSGSGILAYRASFPAKSLIGKAHSIQVEVGNDLHRSGSSVDSPVGTGSPFESVVVTGS
jgi:hypothetical protein